MDAAQYQLDVNATASGDAPDVYPALNVVMRRDAKENNFKVCNMWLPEDVFKCQLHLFVLFTMCAC
jgi:hypothetical protein